MISLLRYSSDRSFLERIKVEIERQKQQFADLPKVVKALEDMWVMRWRELTEGMSVV